MRTSNTLCAKELARRKVKEVYVGMIAPDPRNQGAGIEITVGLLEEEVRQDLEPYLQNEC